tara:strand:+ start:1967 stop:2470 length:504 start_codon:yes stop_codon:yes gene_type:complete
MNCEQCGVKVDGALCSKRMLQMAAKKPDETVRNICIGCFDNNGESFIEKDPEPPLSARVREELAHQSDAADKSTTSSRVLRSIRQHTGTLPANLHKRARYDISKKGRLGKPVGTKLNGETVWECPLCGSPCPRTRATARSLDDVVEHMINSGEYEIWEAEIDTQSQN